MQFFNGVFDGQTVAVPARNVLRIKASQLLGLDDHVFEHFVQGVANVQFAVGVRRAIVQNKQRRSLTGCAQFLVQALVAPCFGPGWLTLGQVAAHRKSGVGHVQSGAVICFLFGHCSKRHKGGLLSGSSCCKKSTRIVTVLGNAYCQGFQAVVLEFVV